MPFQNFQNNRDSNSSHGSHHNPNSQYPFQSYGSNVSLNSARSPGSTLASIIQSQVQSEFFQMYGGQREPKPESKKLLNAYIYDLLMKSSLKKTAKAFSKELRNEELKKAGSSKQLNGSLGSNEDNEKESQNDSTQSFLPMDTVEDTPQGFLLEWWQIFWDVYNAKVSRTGTTTAQQYLQVLLQQQRQEQIYKSLALHAARTQHIAEQRGTYKNEEFDPMVFATAIASITNGDSITDMANMLRMMQQQQQQQQQHQQQQQQQHQQQQQRQQRQQQQQHQQQQQQQQMKNNVVAGGNNPIKSMNSSINIQLGNNGQIIPNTLEAQLSPNMIPNNQPGQMGMINTPASAPPNVPFNWQPFNQFSNDQSPRQQNVLAYNANQFASATMQQNQNQNMKQAHMASNLNTNNLTQAAFKVSQQTKGRTRTSSRSTKKRKTKSEKKSPENALSATATPIVEKSELASATIAALVSPKAINANINGTTIAINKPNKNSFSMMNGIRKYSVASKEDDEVLASTFASKVRRKSTTSLIEIEDKSPTGSRTNVSHSEPVTPLNANPSGTPTHSTGNRSATGFHKTNLPSSLSTVTENVSTSTSNISSTSGKGSSKHSTNKKGKKARKSTSEASSTIPTPLSTDSQQPSNSTKSKDSISQEQNSTTNVTSKTPTSSFTPNSTKADSDSVNHSNSTNSKASNEHDQSGNTSNDHSIPDPLTSETTMKDKEDDSNHNFSKTDSHTNAESSSLINMRLNPSNDDPVMGDRAAYRFENGKPLDLLDIGGMDDILKDDKEKNKQSPDDNTGSMLGLHEDDVSRMNDGFDLNLLDENKSDFNFMNWH